MSANVSSDRPPSPPKTAGRKKIKIQRIEDSRNRQVTFLKRKNGLLKKAMELGILCDCEVTVIIFNLNNGKLFEYSSVEPETVLQKYATYNGPSERRKKERFFELAASKGTSNIPVNEPKLAQAAMDASAAAARRPRPTHKFKNSDTQPGAEQYYNGRKLSSGESPGNLAYRLETPHEIPPGPELEPTRIRASAPTDGFHMHPTSGVVSEHAQNQHGIAGRPPSMSIAPALPSQLSAPSMCTPSTAGRHLSAALGLPTPSASNGQSTRFPFIQQEKEPDHFAASTMLPPPYSGRTSTTPKRETPFLRTETRSVQPKHEFVPLPNPREILAPAGGSAVSHSTENAEVTLQASVVSSEGQLHSDGQLQESSQRAVPRLRPNLTVAIPNPNREDFASGTPSGLHSMSSPSSGNESFRGLMSARLPGMTPTGLGAWAPWNQLTPSERDSIPVPLTPFLNYNLDGSGDSAQLGFGSGHHFSLPSPTNAGLLPLTPRVIGYDPLATSRAEGQSLLPSKRGIDHLFDQTDNQFPKRQR